LYETRQERADHEECLIVARTLAGGQISDKSAYPERDAYGVIRMFAYGLVSPLDSFDCLIAHAAIKFLPVLQRNG
jgi:hypothetical protein